jgi:hypothetical protein
LVFFVIVAIFQAKSPFSCQIVICTSHHHNYKRRICKNVAKNIKKRHAATYHDDPVRRILGPDAKALDDGTGETYSE